MFSDEFRLQKELTMTWPEIKKAVEQAGVGEDESFVTNFRMRVSVNVLQSDKPNNWGSRS